MNLTFKQIPLFCVLIILVGCSEVPFLESTPDYKSTGKSKPLEVPPDLTSITVKDTYSIPGSTTYSDFKEGNKDTGIAKILPNPEGMKIVKAGSQRWLVVNASAEKIWPVIRDFWIDMGFAVKTENPETGVMETEWIDQQDLKVEDKKGALDKFDAWLDRLSGIADRKNLELDLIGASKKEQQRFI